MSNEFIKDISADSVPEIMIIESLCMNCHEMGTTRMLLTRIPFFKDIIVSSFSCEKCGFENREIDPAGKYEDLACSLTLRVENESDLNRRVMRSKHSVIRIPHLDSEFPTVEGDLTTIEGSIVKIIDQLTLVANSKSNIEEKNKLLTFIGRMQTLLSSSSMPYEFVITDSSGMSQLENFKAPAADPQIKPHFYQRSAEECEKLGITYDESNGVNGFTEPESVFNTKNEVITFRVNCHKCNAPCDSNMKEISIPFFKEIIIMATVCDSCGYRDAEVKPGGGFSDRGRRIRLNVTNYERDMTRDLVKSDSAIVRIPSLEFETESGTLGSKYTTVEGLLTDIKDQLCKFNPFDLGDCNLVPVPSNNAEMKNNFRLFLDKLDRLIQGKDIPFELELDDPAGNVYIESRCAPDDDPNITIVDYERSFDDNEQLGINDMSV